MPLYHLVGAARSIPSGRATPVGDGAGNAGAVDCLQRQTHLKIKLAGDEQLGCGAGARQARGGGPNRRGCREWHYSLDFNEKCANVSTCSIF
jgi:hypothetical protein